MNKEQKFLRLVIGFFVIAFGIIFYIFNTMNKADSLFDFLVYESQHKAPASELDLENDFPKTWRGHKTEAVYFRNKYTSVENGPDFVSVKIRGVSPLFCSLILNRSFSHMMNVVLNGKPVFFGSDWRCFKKFKHTMTFQFELYNNALFYKMNEPQYCKNMWDCNLDEGEVCRHNYCKKIKAD